MIHRDQAIDSVRYKIFPIRFFNKGLKPDEFRRVPIKRGFDGYGVSFAIGSDETIWIANGDNNSILCLHKEAITVYPQPFGKDKVPIGVACTRTHIVFITSSLKSRKSSEIVFCNTELKVQRVVSLGKEDTPLPPVWLSVSDDSTKIWLTHRGVNLDGHSRPTYTRLVACEVATGAVIRRWEGVHGIARLPGDVLYVSGNLVSEGNLRVLSLPKSLETDWLLVGVDRMERSYWLASRFSITDRVFSVKLACATAGGDLVWQVPLTDSGGILTELMEKPALNLGWGGDWIEIAPDGTIYVLAWSHTQQIKKAVGLFKVFIYTS